MPGLLFLKKTPDEAFCSGTVIDIALVPFPMYIYVQYFPTGLESGRNLSVQLYICLDTMT